MKKLLVKMLTVALFFGLLQSCLPDNEIQSNAEKEASTNLNADETTVGNIQVIQVNTNWFAPYVFTEGLIALDLDNSGSTDLTFWGNNTGKTYVKSNAGVLKYKKNTSAKSGPYRVNFGEAAPLPNSSFSPPNKEIYFSNLPQEMTYYIGFKVKFDSDQKIHFGWAKVKQKKNTGGFLYEVGINKIPETPISAGQI